MPYPLPFDLLPVIVEQVNYRNDLHACALVSKDFNRAATPFLYRTLDSRIIDKISGNPALHHPSETLNKKPHLARYVRHVTETGAVHRKLKMTHYPCITDETLSALSQCKNLYSLTWIDDSTSPSQILLLFLAVVRKLPLRSLTIRSHTDLGEDIWKELNTFRGLERVSVWSMEGPPRVLQGWCSTLGPTITHLELGRCAGVPTTILIGVISQMPLLVDLRMKGAPANAIWHILPYLPRLEALDIEYLGGASPLNRKRVQPPSKFPTLRNLLVRATVNDDSLWTWIRELVPNTGLESLKVKGLTTFAHNSSYIEAIAGQGNISRMFILDMARVHATTMKRFEVMDGGVMTIVDLGCLSDVFPGLEVLGCTVTADDVVTIKKAIKTAHNLTTLMARVKWVHTWDKVGKRGFSIEDAKDLMKDSRLRTVGVVPALYIAKWTHPGPTLEVTENVAEDKWIG